MQFNKDPTGPAESPETQPELETYAQHVRPYNCGPHCRYVDQHGLVCDVCLWKILDGQAKQRPRKTSLLAACFDGSGMPERVPLSQNSEFKTIKNAVIAEAAKLLSEQTQTAQHSEKQQAEPQSAAGDIALGSMRLLGQISRIIENKIDEGPKPVRVESKLRQEEAEKKQSAGLKIG